MRDEPLTASDVRMPAVRLHGRVGDEMYASFRRQLDAATTQAASTQAASTDAAATDAGRLVVVELSTLGGDPEVARMMGEDVRLASEEAPSCRFAFLGKAAVYSAGATFMSFFDRGDRFFTRGTRLMIHERRMNKELKVAGPLTTCVAGVEAVLRELECSIVIQNEGFAALIRGSSVTLEEVLRRAQSNWYLEAEDACRLGLVRAVL